MNGPPLGPSFHPPMPGSASSPCSPAEYCPQTHTWQGTTIERLALQRQGGWGGCEREPSAVAGRKRITKPSYKSELVVLTGMYSLWISFTPLGPWAPPLVRTWAAPSQGGVFKLTSHVSLRWTLPLTGLTSRDLHQGRQLLAGGWFLTLTNLPLCLWGESTHSSWDVRCWTSLRNRTFGFMFAWLFVCFLLNPAGMLGGITVET